MDHESVGSVPAVLELSVNAFAESVTGCENASVSEDTTARCAEPSPIVKPVTAGEAAGAVTLATLLCALSPPG